MHVILPERNQSRNRKIQAAALVFRNNQQYDIKRALPAVIPCYGIPPSFTTRCSFGNLLTVELQSPCNPVITVQAGIQSKDVNLVFLDSRLRRGDGKFYIPLPILYQSARLCLH